MSTQKRWLILLMAFLLIISLIPLSYAQPGDEAGGNSEFLASSTASRGPLIGSRAGDASLQRQRSYLNTRSGLENQFGNAGNVFADALGIFGQLVDAIGRPNVGRGAFYVVLFMLLFGIIRGGIENSELFGGKGQINRAGKTVAVSLSLLIIVSIIWKFGGASGGADNAAYWLTNALWGWMSVLLFFGGVFLTHKMTNEWKAGNMDINKLAFWVVWTLLAFLFGTFSGGNYWLFVFYNITFIIGLFKLFFILIIGGFLMNWTGFRESALGRRISEYSDHPVIGTGRERENWSEDYHNIIYSIDDLKNTIAKEKQHILHLHEIQRKKTKFYENMERLYDQRPGIFRHGFKKVTRFVKKRLLRIITNQARITRSIYEKANEAAKNKEKINDMLKHFSGSTILDFDIKKISEGDLPRIQLICGQIAENANSLYNELSKERSKLPIGSKSEVSFVRSYTGELKQITDNQSRAISSIEASHETLVRTYNELRNDIAKVEVNESDKSEFMTLEDAEKFNDQLMNISSDMRISLQDNNNIKYDIETAYLLYKNSTLKFNKSGLEKAKDAYNELLNNAIPNSAKKIIEMFIEDIDARLKPPQVPAS